MPWTFCLLWLSWFIDTWKSRLARDNAVNVSPLSQNHFQNLISIIWPNIVCLVSWDTISHHLFATVDTEIPPEAATQQHVHICNYWQSGLAWVLQPKRICAIYFENIVHWRYNAVNFLTNIHKNTHSLPVRTRYGVFLCIQHLNCVSVPVIIYVISYDFGPRYNGTQMYCWW